jgi:hypothetical protein
MKTLFIILGIIITLSLTGLFGSMIGLICTDHLLFINAIKLLFSAFLLTVVTCVIILVAIPYGK